MNTQTIFQFLYQVLELLGVPKLSSGTSETQAVTVIQCLKELSVEAAFKKTSISTSTGPEILFLKRFKDHWEFVNRESFLAVSSDALVKSLAASYHFDILEFALVYLHVEQPRDNYSEFLKLSAVFLGDVPTSGT